MQIATHSNILVWKNHVDRGTWRPQSVRSQKNETRLSDWATTLLVVTQEIKHESLINQTFNINKYFCYFPDNTRTLTKFYSIYLPSAFKQSFSEKIFTPSKSCSNSIINFYVHKYIYSYRFTSCGCLSLSVLVLLIRPFYWLDEAYPDYQG